MALYVGRESETQQLLELKSKRTSSLVVCHGRRRVGKSTFVRKSAESVEHFFSFEGLPPRPGLSEADQLHAFAGQLSDQTDLPRIKLESWPQAFQLLASAIPRRGRSLLLLDEISWMATGAPDFPGHLKAAWDSFLAPKPKLIVVLCGSVSSWINRNILNNQGFVGRCSLVIRLRPLPLPPCNAFWRGKPVATQEKLKILGVTGGIPRYLEEVNPSQSAARNVQRLCFDPGGLLFREFDQIFHDMFARRAPTYREVVRTLRDGRCTTSKISKALRQGRGGTLSSILTELEQAGFICRDTSFDIKTGVEQPRGQRYRLCDNYLRFYLKYVAPHRAKIEKGLYRVGPLESLTAWDTIMGLQFENLILSSMDQIRGRLGLTNDVIVNEGPYSQSKTARREACQIDLLVRTKHAIWVVEAKLRKKIGRSVIAEVKRKVERLKPPRGLSVRKALIYDGELEASIADEDFFDKIVPFGQLLE